MPSWWVGRRVDGFVQLVKRRVVGSAHLVARRVGLSSLKEGGELGLFS